MLRKISCSLSLIPNNRVVVYNFCMVVISDGSGIEKVGFGPVRVWPNYQKSGSGGK